MHQATVSQNAIIPYTDGFSPFLSSLSWPVALIPPALYEMFGDSVGSGELDAALCLLGFSEIRPVSSGLGILAASLAAEAKARADGPLLFSACPDVRKIARSEYPDVFDRFASTLPPADLVAQTARRDHPEATLFFISPCSSRAKALLPLVDYAVPFHTIFPALLDAIRSVTGTEPRITGESTTNAHVGGINGYTDYVPSTAAIRSWFDDFKAKENARQSGTCIELVICKGGCGQGDWAPKS